MDNLKIETGAKRLSINDDPDRVISFDPSDVGFAERYYDLIRQFTEQESIYQKQYAALVADARTDKEGLPANLPDRIALLKETCTFIRDRIDYVFGAGTSQVAFGDSNSLAAIRSFFDGIGPHIATVRADKVQKYIVEKPARKPRKRTTKAKKK